MEDKGSRSGFSGQLLELTPFGKYTLVARVGIGGMAEVFLAAFAGPGRFRKLLVIKRLHAHLADEDGFLEMFLDEARLAARLHHPNVVQTYEVDDVDGQYFLAMEHLDGQPVNRVMRKCGQRGHGLPVRLAVRIVTDALDGLHYAHELRDYDGTPLNVVHRDISPVNIFVTYGGEVKLLDFGIAKAATQFQHTRTGQLKGKFAYMAPEHARDEGIDRRSDVFSMGVVLWELLTGRRLFKGDNELATYHNVVTAEITPPSSYSPSICKELSDIAMKALCRDREDRFQSALEMKQALERVAKKERLAATRAELSKFASEIFVDERAADAKILERCMNAELPVHEASTAPRAAAPASRPPSTSPGTRPGHEGSYRSGSKSGSKSGTVFDRGPPRRSDQIALAADENGPATWEAPSESHFRQAPDAIERAARRRRARVIALSMIAIVFGASMTLLLRNGGSEQPPEPTARVQDFGPIVPAPMHSTIVRTAAPAIPVTPVQAPATPVLTSVSAPTAVEPLAVPEEEPQIAPASTRDERPLTRRERERRRRRAQQQHTVSAVAQERTRPSEPESPPPAEAEPVAEQGFLTLDTVPWAQVSLNGRTLGSTPLVRERLPVGEHVLTLTNPEQGIRTTYRVHIEPGATTVRRLGLE